MIVYDKEQKEIVIPNGIGNINLYNNGVEAGYNQGYEQGQADMAAKARVLDVTENGVYRTKFSDPIPPELVTGVYADGTEFHNYAELNGKVFNTKIAGSVDSRLEFWYKGDNTLAGDAYNVIIGSGNNDDSDCFQVRYVMFTNNNLSIGVGNSIINFGGWDDTVWHHLIISKEEGLWTDGKKRNWDFSPTNTVNGEFFINGINYDINSDRAGTRNANGCFGMIKIDDTIIIPTADGFLNTNTGELLEVVKDGSYTFRENDPIYGEGELYKTINVNVPDLNGSYDEGYAQGKTDGINEQKSKLESISITENGTYRKEDGYNEVVVNVADLNGSYDEGYNQGQADVAANARVLNVTENGNYLSKFSDPIIPTLVTGEYADGTDFYSYAELNGKVFNTKITPTENSRLEFWYKGDNENAGKSFNVIIGAEKSDGDGYEIMYNMDYNSNLRFELGLNAIEYTWDDTVWHHILIAKEKEDDSWMTLWIDEVKIREFGNIPFNPQSPFYINCVESNTDLSKNANGYFGMIKIDDVVIIPTADGFQNVNTGELLEVVKDGAYIFTENAPIYPEGELYKTINVNVLPKVNVQKEGVKLNGSTFTEVPDWVDLEGVTSLNGVFSNCTNLLELPILNVPYCTDFDSVFLNTTFADLTNIQHWVYPKNAKWSQAFGQNYNIEKCPAIYMEGNTDYYQGFPFWGYSNYNNFTDFGGFIGLKYSITQDYSFPMISNLTKESCINVLNGLYDFTGNGEVPNSEQGHLKVAQSFIDKVGDEISIGINKGWVISA